MIADSVMTKALNKICDIEYLNDCIIRCIYFSKSRFNFFARLPSPSLVLYELGGSMLQIGHGQARFPKNFAIFTKKGHATVVGIFLTTAPFHMIGHTSRQSAAKRKPILETVTSIK
jgi:hypothetical protein